MVLCNLSGRCWGWRLPGDCGDTPGWHVRACPTPNQGAGQLGGSPSPGHQPPPWGQGQAEARKGHQPVGGPGFAGPKAGCEELETSPAAAVLGQGLMAPGGAEVWSWAHGGGPGGSWSGQKVL